MPNSGGAQGGEPGRTRPSAARAPAPRPRRCRKSTGRTRRPEGFPGARQRGWSCHSNALSTQQRCPRAAVTRAGAGTQRGLQLLSALGVVCPQEAKGCPERAAGWGGPVRRPWACSLAFTKAPPGSPTSTRSFQPEGKVRPSEASGVGTAPPCGPGRCSGRRAGNEIQAQLECSGDNSCFWDSVARCPATGGGALGPGSSPLFPTQEAHLGVGGETPSSGNELLTWPPNNRRGGGGASPGAESRTGLHPRGGSVQPGCMWLLVPGSQRHRRGDSVGAAAGPARKEASRAPAVGTPRPRALCPGTLPARARGAPMAHDGDKTPRNRLRRSLRYRACRPPGPAESRRGNIPPRPRH